MNLLKQIFTACLLLTVSAAFAQKNYQQDYLNAKYLFKEQKYALAMEAFKPLIPKNEANYFSEYSSFYFALSAYYKDYQAVAKDMFLQLKQFYPKWSRIDEVNFWLGKIYLENDQFEEGIKVLNSIKSTSLKDDVANLKYFSFSTIGDVDQLKSIYADNQSEKELGEVLAQQLARAGLTMDNRLLLEELVEKFNLDPKEYNVLEVKPVFKDTYKVAVLLPFMVNNLEINKKPKMNQFVLDIYQGIRLAYDSLKNAGHSIELFTYDTKRDTAETRNILQKDELKSMDVIIGPLQTQSVHMVSDFSLKYRINMINPLWTNSSLTVNNPFSFLYNPCNETIATETAEYALTKVRDKPGIIFYGQSRDDSVKAYAYKQRMEQDSFNIVLTKKIPHDETRSILDILLIENARLSKASSDESREEYGIALDSIGHIFVASDHNLISSKVLSAVETRGDSIKVVGSANWLELSIINYEKYNRLGVILYAPSFKPRNTDSYKAFRKRYIVQHKKTPNKMVENGYELMMMLGGSFKEYGKYFQIGWNKEDFIKGHLSMGYRYKYANDNKIVPMLNFEDDGLTIYYPTEFDEHGNKKE